MPFGLEGAQTADAYSDACALQRDKNTIQASFYCLDNPVMVQVFKRNPRMPLSQPVWDGIERFYPAGGGDTFVGPIGGLYFRSFNPGQSARIFAVQTFATDVTSMASGFGGGNPFSGGGNGIQFGGPSPVYGPDNVGQYLHVETTGVDLLGRFGATFDNAFGLLITGTDAANNDAVVIQQTVAAANNVGYESINIQNDSGGPTQSGNFPTGIQITTSVNGPSCNGNAIIANVIPGESWSQSAPLSDILGGVQGIIINAGQTSPGTTSGNVVGLAAQAVNFDTGLEISGYFINGGGQTGANSLTIRCDDHTGAATFDIRDNGQVHAFKLPTSAAGLSAGALWNNAGVVNIV